MLLSIIPSIYLTDAAEDLCTYIHVILQNDWTIYPNCDALKRGEYTLLRDSDPSINRYL